MQVDKRIKLFVIILGLVCMAQAFTGGLSTATLQKLYTQSVLSSYQVVGQNFSTKVSEALRFGKTLDTFVGIRFMLKKLETDLPELAEALIVANDGRILHSLGTKANLPELEKTLADQEMRTALGRAAAGDAIREGEHRYVVFPVRNRDASLAGFLVLVVNEQTITRNLPRGFIANPKLFGLSIAGAMALLALGMIVLFSREISPNQARKRLYFLVFGVLLLGQFISAYFNLVDFREKIVMISSAKIESMSTMLKGDIEFLFKKGLTLNRLANIDAMLGNIVAVTPELDVIGLTDPEHTPKYLADRNGVVRLPAEGQLSALTGLDGAGVGEAGDSADARYNIRTPLYKAPRTETNPEQPEYLQGYIQARLSEHFVERQVREISYDSITVMVISFLFAFEMVNLLFAAVVHRLENSDRQSREKIAEKNAEKSADLDSAQRLIRPVTFLFLLAVSLSHSFIPLKMEQLYEPILSLSKDVVLGLPISVEMLVAGVSLIPIGVWLDRRGWLEPLLLGMVLSCLGAVASGLAANAGQFIAARGLMGIGYAMTWLASQGYVFALSSQKSRARGIANLVAGIFAGQICGAAMGGMLSERLGFDSVFFLAALLIACLAVLSVAILRPHFSRPAGQEQVGSAERVPGAESGNRAGLSFGKAVRYLVHRRILAVLLLGVIPLNVCIVGIMMYLTPLYLKGIGSTSSDIGRVLMIFGLFSIYLAPQVGRLVDRAASKIPFIIASGVAGSLGMLVFEFFSGQEVMILSISLLGLSASLGVSAQTIFALDTRAAEDIGTGKALSIQRSAEKLGQMIGPLAFGAIITMQGQSKGLFMVGVAYLLATLLFFIVTFGCERTGDSVHNG